MKWKCAIPCPAALARSSILMIRCLIYCSDLLVRKSWPTTKLSPESSVSVLTCLETSLRSRCLLPLVCVSWLLLDPYWQLHTRMTQHFTIFLHITLTYKHFTLSLVPEWSPIYAFFFLLCWLRTLHPEGQFL